MCIVIGGVVCSGQLTAQSVQVDVSACRTMLTVLKTMKSHASRDSVSVMLDSVLDSKAYRVMFSHYNRSWRSNHLPREVFKRMILSVEFPGEYTLGENQRADQMLPFWSQSYRNLSIFEGAVGQVETIDLKALINDGVKYAQSWLPPGWAIPDFYFLILPNGGSPAFTIDHAQGYDFFQLPRDSSNMIGWNMLIGTISHESFHLGMGGSVLDSMTLSPSDSLALRFISLFVGEGTATKFIDNAPGGCVPAVDPSRPDPFESVRAADWETYSTEEAQIIKQMVTTFDKIYRGELNTEDVDREFRYWLGGKVGPAYFVGSELFGAIYAVFGKEQVFAAMRDPRKLFTLYNSAIEKNAKLLGSCPRIPKSTALNALAISPIMPHD